MLPAVYQRAPNLPLTRNVKYVMGRNTSYTSASRWYGKCGQYSTSAWRRRGDGMIAPSA